MTNVKYRGLFNIRHWITPSSFACRAVAARRRVIRLPRRSRAKAGHSAFTIMELLVVITIIIILGGLILGTSGYVQKKGARSRAEAEIAAISAACESYKADNGTYPRDLTNHTTDNLDPRTSADPTRYRDASRSLYDELFGAISGSRTATAGKKTYFVFRTNMLSPTDQAQNVQYIRDPFGNSYGYSTAYQADVENGVSPPARGYNPTFDLWSTGGTTTGGSADQSQWIKNW